VRIISSTWLPSSVSYSSRHLAITSSLSRCVNDVACDPVFLVDDAFDFRVDLLRRGFAVVLAANHLAAEENEFVVSRIAPVPSLSLMPNGKPSRGEVGGLLDIAGGAGEMSPEMISSGDAAAMVTESYRHSLRRRLNTSSFGSECRIRAIGRAE